MPRRPSLFARFDLDYPDHPKIVGLSDGAFRMHVEMILYARKYMTDGVIDKRVAKRFANRLGKPALDELLANDNDAPSLTLLSDGNYLLHGYEEMQETKAEIAAKRQVNAANGRRGGLAKGKRTAKRIASETLSENVAETETETETEEEEPKGSSGTHKRASRLSADWSPTLANRTYATDRGVDPDHEAEKFRNYWLATAGRNAAKVDWDATWRNWIIRAAEGGARRTAVNAQPPKSIYRDY